MYIADLHIHSRFSRATSRDCDAPHLDLWARRKGIQLIGSGDFTHAVWREELSEQLVEAEEGFYRLRDEHVLPYRVAGDVHQPRFVVSGEISTIYKKNGRTRKVHHVFLLPGLEAAETLSHRLEAIGNLHSDGRPILGLDSRALLEIALESCDNLIYIPAHIWTPHFSVFGAFSGFETLEECYGDLTPYVHALETGLSSDPPMNRRLSALDGYTLVSNSDAHSPAKLGREANVLDCDFSYTALKHAIETGEGLHGTIEFFPEEGKYHLDGHRACGQCLTPSETAQLDGRCPVCGRKLTIGVLNRVDALADRADSYRHPSAKPFESLIPLPEVLANCMGVSPAAKRVQTVYLELLSRVGSEFSILRELPPQEAERAAGFAVGEALRRLRAGRVIRHSGYDGEYGAISLFEPNELEVLGGQTTLIDMVGMTSGTAKRTRTKAMQDTIKATATPLNSGDEISPITKETLNDEQQQAVDATERAVAVIAGPGTGKTKTLVARIAALIEQRGVSPSEITAVTFTNQAAVEMRERLEARLGGKKALRGLTAGTFHAICLQLLPSKPIISDAQALQLLAELLAEYDLSISPTECLYRLSAIRNGKSAAECGLSIGFVQAYDDRLRTLCVRDLDGVLLEALALDTCKRQMFTHLLVDEFQDINALQRQLVERWSAHSQSLFVIGDPDQSIYGFRGASAACFDALQASLPDLRIITLAQNYRSSPAVVQSALSVIANNGGRERMLIPHRPQGASVRVMNAPDAFSQNVWIAKEIGRMAGGVDMLDAQTVGNERVATHAFCEIGILCRTRRQLEQLETCLRHDSIPCVIYGRDEYLNDRRVQGVLGFFRSLLQTNDTASLVCALKQLWHCPDALLQRAAVALSSMETVSHEALYTLLSPFEPLAPWLCAVEALYPRMTKEKPRKLIEALLKLLPLKTRPTELLLNTAVFHNDISAFLQSLLTGEDVDIRRISGSSGISGSVRLMTLHGAKGLEFPVVFIAGATAGTLPMESEKHPADLAEERRLFFVGITRARDELIITSDGEPSRFLQELAPGVERQEIHARKRIPKSEQLSLL